MVQGPDADVSEADDPDPDAFARFDKSPAHLRGFVLPCHQGLGGVGLGAYHAFMRPEQLAPSAARIVVSLRSMGCNWRVTGV